VIVSAQHGMLVRRAQRRVAVPLVAGSIGIRAVLGEQPDELGAASAVHRRGDVRAVVRIGAVLEQQAQRLEAIEVERVQEGIRAARFRAVLEQQAQAFRVVGLDRVIQRLTVVGIGAGQEQEPRELRIVQHPGGAVERRRLAPVGREAAVAVGAELEQFTDEHSRPEHGVARVEHGRPSARSIGLVDVAAPVSAEDEPRPRVAVDLRLRGEYRLGLLALAICREEDEVSCGGRHTRRPSSSAMRKPLSSALTSSYRDARRAGAPDCPPRR